MTEQQSIERRAFTKLVAEATVLLERIRQDSSRTHDILRILDTMSPCDHTFPNGQSAYQPLGFGIRECQLCKATTT